MACICVGSIADWDCHNGRFRAPWSDDLISIDVIVPVGLMPFVLRHSSRGEFTVGPFYLDLTLHREEVHPLSVAFSPALAGDFAEYLAPVRPEWAGFPALLGESTPVIYIWTIPVIQIWTL